jgi:hypothetical protein
MPTYRLRGGRVFCVMCLCVVRRNMNRGNLAFPDSSCLTKCMSPTTLKHFNAFILIAYYFLRLFLTDSSVSVVTICIKASRSAEIYNKSGIHVSTTFITTIIGLHVSTDHSVIFRSLICCKF